MSDNQIKALEKLINEKFKNTNFRLGLNTKATNRIEKKLDDSIERIEELEIERKVREVKGKSFSISLDEVSIKRFFAFLTAIAVGAYGLYYALWEVIVKGGS